MRGLLGVEGEIKRDAGAKEIFAKYPGIKIVAEPVADWIQAKAKDRMTEVLRSQPKIDVVYGHNDPMAIGAYLAAKELDREKEMIFVGVDGLGGPAGGIKKVMDGVLGATFVYPLCVDKTVEIGLKMLRDPAFKPEKDVQIPSVDGDARRGSGPVQEALTVEGQSFFVVCQAASSPLFLRGSRCRRFPIAPGKINARTVALVDRHAPALGRGEFIHSIRGPGPVGGLNRTVRRERERG